MKSVFSRFWDKLESRVLRIITATINQLFHFLLKIFFQDAHTPHPHKTTVLYNSNWFSLRAHLLSLNVYIFHKNILENFEHLKLHDIKIVYYVPRQSSRCLYEDTEFNCIRVETAWLPIRYIQYFIWKRKRKREFFCRGAEFKLRLIILRTCTCEVISHLYRNKLDVAERGEGSKGRRLQWEVWEARPPLGVQGRSPFRGVSLPFVVVQ